MERMYLRQRPKSENWASLTPRSSATVRCREKFTRPSKLPGPWTTTWSNVNIFENVFPDSSAGHRSTFRGQIWWKSAVAKLPKGRVDYHTQKPRAPRDSSRPPFCPKWADRAQNSLNVVNPWRVHVYWIWSGSAALCRTYSGMIDFSAKKGNAGFQLP